MPQFDFNSFFAQSFWITIGTFVFYLIYTRYFLTNTSEVLKIREKLKESSLIFSKYKTNVVGYYDSAVNFFKKR